MLVPMMPQTTVETLKTNIASFSFTACARRNSRVQRSLSVIVAELFRLVSIVLMAAAASAAMMSPPKTCWQVMSHEMGGRMGVFELAFSGPFSEWAAISSGMDW